MVILGILGTCMHINGSAILQKRSTPKQTKFNCQIDDWQLNLRVQPTNDLSARPSQFIGNFYRRPSNSISVQGNVSLICPIFPKPKVIRQKRIVGTPGTKIYPHLYKLQ